jgi:outer membrane protein assembly factor BamB
MARHTDRLFVGLGGHIVAVDAASGEEIWRTHLKGSDVVTVTVAGNRVFGGTKGELFCVDPSTGSILWHNRLKGLGTGILAFASTGAEIPAAVKTLEAAQAAGAAAAG